LASAEFDFTEKGTPHQPKGVLSVLKWERLEIFIREHVIELDAILDT